MLGLSKRTMSEEFLLEESAGAGYFGFGAFGDGGFDVVVVGAGDDFEFDLFGAGGFAFTDVGAVGKTLDVHLLDHRESTALTFGLALREMAEMRDLCSNKKNSSGIWTRGDTGTATDAGGGIHGEISVFLGNRYGVAIGGTACGRSDETAGGDDAVEGTAIDSEVFDHRKCFGTPGLEVEHVAVFEMPHVQLAHRGARETTVSFAVDHEPAHTADAFAAIVIEGDGIFALGDKGFVENIEHFKEGHVLVHVGVLVAHHAAFVLGIFLAPDVESEFHL